MHVPDRTMIDTKRAQNVCHACMLRKKACDKALPGCGFCASRLLVCRYDVSAPKSKDRRAYNPGRHFVALQSLSPPSGSSHAKTLTRQLPSPRNQIDHTSIHQFSLYVLPQSVEESLNQLAQHFTEHTKLTYDNIIDRYFQESREWLPVVLPSSLRREASRYREEERLSPADFTTLRLVMLLFVIPALNPSLRPPHASQEFFYTTTKSAFAQAQASICTSLRLVQAALLIALYEYISIRPDAAYISITTCVGLARVLGVGTTSVRTMRDAPKESDVQSDRTERENLARAIAVLERYELTQI